MSFFRVCAKCHKASVDGARDTDWARTFILPWDFCSRVSESHYRAFTRKLLPVSLLQKMQKIELYSVITTFYETVFRDAFQHKVTTFLKTYFVLFFLVITLND